jgi:uracil-DNA glycosylase family 4
MSAAPTPTILYPKPIIKDDPYVDILDTPLIHRGPACCALGVAGFGNPTMGVVFVGISPARDEMKTRRPLTGPSGRLLNAMLKAVEFPRQDTYATNLICWWKDDPSKEHIGACAPRLARELAEVQPKLIITLGALVTEAFLGKKLRDCRGAVLWSTTYNCYIMATYHPAAILHALEADGYRGSPNAAFDLYRDLSKIKAVLKWPPNASHGHVPYGVVESRAAAQALLDRLPRDKPVALDTETSSKKTDEIDVFDDELLCLSISDGSAAFVFPRDTLDNLVWPADVRWTFHNALFDVQVMRKHLHVRLPVHEDTMLQSYSLDERPGYHGLKALAREYIGAGFWEAAREKTGRKGQTAISLMPKDDLYKYNAHDAAYTARLHRALRPQQDADNVRTMYEQWLIPAVNVFSDIQYRGVKVDISLLNEFDEKWTEAQESQRADLEAQAAFMGWEAPAGSDAPINLNSPIQLCKLFYDIESFDLAPDNSGRKVRRSTDKAALEWLEQQTNHPFIPALGKYRHLTKMLSTYVHGLRDKIKADGRVHATVKLHGTSTGRLAYTDPPLQTIPARYEDSEFARLRELFIPSTPDNIVIEADYGKAEIWMAYYYSGDDRMLADLLSGDYHKAVASSVMRKPISEVTPLDRLNMKAVTFGVMYGREAFSLAKAIDSTPAEAQEYIDNFFKRYPQYAAWYQRTIDEALKTAELVTKTGRKRRFMFLGGDSDHRALKQAVNNNIQSGAADCTLSSVLELHDALDLYDAHIMVSVHDSIVLECPIKNQEQVIALVHRVMTAPRYPGVGSLPVEIKVGPSWGTTKEVHNCEDTCLK